MKHWFAKLSGALLAHGFVQIKADYSLFTFKKGIIFTTVLVYVDDMVVVRNNNQAIKELKKFLHMQFHLKDLGELKYFLGLEVIRTAEGIFVCQRKCRQDFLKEVRMTGYTPLQLPLTPNVKLLAETGTFLKDPNKHRRLIGKLI